MIHYINRNLNTPLLVCLYNTTMKVLLILTLASYATAEAPYAPSGYRPQGEPFTLPPFKLSQPARQPQLQYGAPPSPQGQYLPPSNNNGEATSVKPLNERVSSALRPEDQYVLPRPSNAQYFRPQSEFEPQTQYAAPSGQQSFPQQTTAFVRPFQAQQREYEAPQSQLESQTQYDALYRQQSLPQQIAASVQPFQAQQREYEAPQSQREPQTQYGAPATEQNVPQENFDDEQRLISNQQPERNVQPKSNPNEGVYVTRRVVQRRRKQQRGDQNYDALEVSGLGNRHNRPASAYGVPTTARSVYLTRKATEAREPESTTRPAKRFRTTTIRTDESTNEEDNEDTTGPNVSIATAVAGRYYILQTNGQLQQLRNDNEENDKPNEFTANLIVQNPNPFREPVYTFNAPLIRLNK